MLQVYITNGMHLKYSKIFYVTIAYSRLQYYSYSTTVALCNLYLGNSTTIFGKLRVCRNNIFQQLLGAPPKGRATKN